MAETDEVVEALEAPAPTEHVNPADDARNDVRAAIEKLRGPAEEPPAETEPEPLKADDRPRGPDGKFLPKTEAAPSEAAPVAPKSPPVDDATKASAQPSTAASAPPVSWAADAKASWNALPPAIQNAVLKREAEVSNGFRQKSEEVKRYEAVLSPVAEAAQRRGLSAEQGINALMAAQDRLDRNPAEAIAWLAKSYGVDLATLASNPPAPQPQRFDPVVPELTQKLSSLENQVQTFLQSQTMGVIESFASSHPHYAAVENEIARLIPLVKQAEPGLSHSEVLQKAYDQAVWLNPDVRNTLISEQQAEAEKTRNAALQSKAKQATKAAVSIRGSSNGASPPPKVPVGGDVYDDVRNAINQLRQ